MSQQYVNVRTASHLLGVDSKNIPFCLKKTGVLKSNKETWLARGMNAAHGQFYTLQLTQLHNHI